MTVFWIEGFEGFGTSGAADSLNYKYPSNNILANFTVQPGRLGAFAMLVRGGGGQVGFITTPNLGNISTICTGFAFKPQVLLNATIVALREADDTTQGVNIRQQTDGKIGLYRNNTLLGTTANVELIANTWHHVELKVTVAESGSYELRVNGINVLSGSGDTREGSNDYCNRVRLNGPDTAAGNAPIYDDWFVASDFLGDKKVLTLFPDADGAIDFTPSTGSDNYAMVDDTGPDDDSTYVESSTPGDADLYSHGAMTGATTVLGVQLNIVAKKSDVTDYDMHLSAKSGSTTSDGSTAAVNSTSYANFHRIIETDPDTGVAWTESGLNSAQFGPKVG